MATLTNPVSATQRRFRITTPGSPRQGARYQVGDELVELAGYWDGVYRQVEPHQSEWDPDETAWYVTRGVEGTLAVGHAQGVSIVEFDVTEGGGGGISEGDHATIDHDEIPGVGLDTTEHAAIDHTGIPGVGGGSGGVRWIGPFTIGCFDGQQFEDNVAGSIDGGTFTATLNGETTSPLAWDVSAATFKTALEVIAGAGNVLSVVGSDVNGGYIVTFKDGVAEDYMTGDSSLLTGPDSPYDVHSLPYGWTVPLVTLPVGDIILDIIHSIPTAWGPGMGGETPTVRYTSDPDNVDGSSSIWASSMNDDLGMRLDVADAFIHFTGAYAGDPGYQFSAFQRQLVSWTSDGTAFDYVPTAFPRVATQEVTIHASIDLGGLDPDEGLLRIWVNVATPEAP